MIVETVAPPPPEGEHKREDPFNLASAYSYAIFLGFLGGHHMYLRRYAWGFLFLFTFGGCGLGLVYDLIFMPSLVSRSNFLARPENARYLREHWDGDCWRLWANPLFGLLGAHHFYLGRPGWGFCYFFTFGLLGCGWLLDCFFLNRTIQEANYRDGAGDNVKEGEPVQVEAVNLMDTYRLYFPLGFLGLHHFYLGRTGFGLTYLFTFGLVGLGWLTDLCYIPTLIEQANSKKKPVPYSLYIAYQLAIPLGFLGFHRFYLGHKAWGMFYLLTFGMIGLGWLKDLFVMPAMVREANQELVKESENSYLNQPRLAVAEDGHLCVICQDQAINTRLSCGHSCTCAPCAAKVMASANPSCPQCQKPIQHMSRTDLSVAAPLPQPSAPPMYSTQEQEGSASSTV